MNHCVEKLWTVVALLLLCAFPLAANPANAAIEKLTTEHFEVLYEGIDARVAQQFAGDAETAYSAISTFLGRHPPRPIRFRINNHIVFPRYDRDSGDIFIPANRIRGNVGLSSGQSERGPGLMLVIPPMIAPSANKQWGDFLETGLRVFLQEKFEKTEVRPFPTMGGDLHEETAALAADYGRLIPIAEVEKARTWRTKMTRTRRLAYLQAGSFVRFLVERYGIEKFMGWYDGRSVGELFNRDIAVLEREWETHIRTRQR